MSDQTRTLETLELVGGALCLDFTNTINSRRLLEYDYLHTYSDLVGWAIKLKIAPASLRDRLQKPAKKDAGRAEAALTKAVRIRELLYRIFSAAAGGSTPAPEDLAAFARQYAKAISRGALVSSGGYYTIEWDPSDHPNTVLWPVIYSAGQTLFSPDLAKVKECPGCGWLFLDTSKNHSRRWCSMNTCGARDKMRRYHHRKRAA